jgi:hypothetical protein
MPVTENKQTQQDINQEIQESEARKAAAINAILPSLSLPDAENPDVELNAIRAKEQAELRNKRLESRDAKIAEKEKKAEEAKKAKEVESKEDTKEESSEEKEEVSTETEEGDTEDTDEDLIPKSKVEKRFKALTAKIKELELKAQAIPERVVSDPDMQKLEQMTPEELKVTLRNVRAKQLKISSGDDNGNIDDYTDLEMKVHEALNTYNTRFYNSQVTELNKAIESVQYDEDIEDPIKALPELKRIAEKIYADHPGFRTQKSGMGTAYKLAIEHYKVIQDSLKGKDDQSRTKRENVRLKRKTTLDTSKVKGDSQGNRKLELIRKKMASGANDQDRTDFVKESPMFNVDNLIPDEWK